MCLNENYSNINISVTILSEKQSDSLSPQLSNCFTIHN